MGMKKVKKIELKSELPMIFAHQFNHKVIFFIKSACIFLKFSDNHIKFWCIFYKYLRSNGTIRPEELGSAPLPLPSNLG
jgi:hypothetical protein